MTTAKVKATPAAKQVETAVAAGKETIDQVVKASQEAATQGIEKAVALSKEQVEAAAKAQESAFKAYEDSLVHAKEHLDAFVKASQVLGTGLQEISKSVVDLAKQNVEEGVAASKQLASVKSLQELVDLQSSLAKTQLERLVAEGSRLHEETLKLFQSAFGPLGAQAQAAIEKLLKKAA